MTNIDQFESVFRSAAKSLFEYREVAIRSAVFVTDLDELRARPLGDRLRTGLASIRGTAAGDVEWRDVCGDEFSTIEDLLRILESASPDLVCTYRTLHSSAWRWCHSLGEFVEVLTQATPYPVLLLPHPADQETFDRSLGEIRTVMAMTDHLTGDHELVNRALAFTGAGGRLILANVEDRATFERYMDAIAKIPSIDTDNARETILERLQKEPLEYAQSCAQVIDMSGVDVTVGSAVEVGAHLKDYRRLVSEHDVDLLVLHTKDAEQAAMHGLAYPLAVEINEIPLLLL